MKFSTFSKQSAYCLRHGNQCMLLVFMLGAISIHTDTDTSFKITFQATNFRNYINMLARMLHGFLMRLICKHLNVT